MKPCQKCYFWPLHFFVCCTSLFFSSCDFYNFSQAQPVDKENIYEFPKEFQGNWTAANDNGNWIASNDNIAGTFNSTKTLKEFQRYRFSGSVFQSILKKKDPDFRESGHSKNDDSVLYFVDKKSAMFIIHTKEKILTGAWPRLNSKGDFLYPPDSYSSIKKIEYDSLQKPIDTIDNYLLRGNYIYEVDDEGMLGKGYSYLSSKDRITVFKYDTICIDLGQNAFLRKLDANFYVLNIRKTILGEESYWWRIMVLEKNNDQSFNIWECTSKSEKLPSMFYSRDSKITIFYFDSKWTSAEMLRLINEGYFRISTDLIKIERRSVSK